MPQAPDWHFLIRHRQHSEAQAAGAINSLGGLLFVPRHWQQTVGI
jgi:hypothetical protein